MRVQLKPLQEWYKTIQLRATELESYFTCPFKHKFWKQDFSNNDALLFGSLTHAVLQSFFFSEKAGIDTLGILCPKYEDRCKTIYDYISLIEADQLHKKYSLICTEYKCVTEIEMWKYLIILEGTLDAISRDSNWWYTIIDFKTSKAEWKPETYDNKIQKYIYPWLLAQLVGEDNMHTFDYLIFTKHVKPRLQVLKTEMNWPETNEFIFNLLESYCFALENSMRNPKICHTCFFCPVKETCPLKQVGNDEEF